MRKQSRLGTLLAVLLLAALCFAASDSLTPNAASATVWRGRRYARLSHYHYRTRYHSRALAVQVTPAGDVWARLRACESGGAYNRNSGNGYYGAYQFSASTWHRLGYAGMPHQADP